MMTTPVAHILIFTHNGNTECWWVHVVCVCPTSTLCVFVRVYMSWGSMSDSVSALLVVCVFRSQCLLEIETPLICSGHSGPPDSAPLSAPPCPCLAGPPQWGLRHLRSTHTPKTSTKPLLILIALHFPYNKYIFWGGCSSVGRAGWLVIRRSLVRIPAPQGGTELHVEVSMSKILNPKVGTLWRQPLPSVRVLRWAGDSSRMYPGHWEKLDLAPVRPATP